MAGLMGALGSSADPQKAVLSILQSNPMFKQASELLPLVKEFPATIEKAKGSIIEQVRKEVDTRVAEGLEKAGVPVVPPEGNAGAEEGNMGAAEGNMGAAEGNMGAAEGNMGAAEGNMGAAEGNAAAAEGNAGAEENVPEEEGGLAEALGFGGGGRRRKNASKSRRRSKRATRLAAHKNRSIRYKMAYRKNRRSTRRVSRKNRRSTRRANRK